jgi:large subunit ribosomal protein L5
MDKLNKIYTDKIAPELFKELKCSNIFEVPRIEKIVISTGIGDYKEDKGAVERIALEVARIAGAKPKTNLSTKAVSAFKLRIGQPVGLTVTLRGERMYDFISKLVNVALPRIRDFRGVSATSFDKQGNFSLGIKDYSIFPEVKFEELKEIFGLEINFRIKARNRDEAKALLLKLGFPFKKGSN